jgi:hypothetical protein
MMELAKVVLCKFSWTPSVHWWERLIFSSVERKYAKWFCFYIRWRLFVICACVDASLREASARKC